MSRKCQFYNPRLKGSFYSDKTFGFHKLCKKFPRMKSDRIMEISESVLEFGQQEDIILLNGLILDGRHLYWACKAAGITPRFRNYDSNLKPWNFVKIRNFHRRDLTTAQRAALALEDLRIERKKAKERQIQTYFKDNNKKQETEEKNTVGHPGSPTVTTDKKGKSIDIVAKEWRIAPKSLRKADKINKIAKDNPFIKRYWKKAQDDNIPLEQVYRNIKKALDIQIAKIEIPYQALNKVEKIYEASKTNPDIKEQWEKVKKNEISLDLANQNVNKIESLNKSIRKHNVDFFNEAGKKLINIKEENSIKRKYICKRCPKATVMAIECEFCGHPTAKVLCDDDMINGSRKLRNPSSKLCKNSPDYDLISVKMK